MITIIVNINIMDNVSDVKSIIYFFTPLLLQDVKRNDAFYIVPFDKPYFHITFLLFRLRNMN